MTASNYDPRYSHPQDLLMKASEIPEEIKALLTLATMSIGGPQKDGTEITIWASQPRPGLFKIVKVIDFDYDIAVEQLGAQFIRGLQLAEWQRVLGQYITDTDGCARTDG